MKYLDEFRDGELAGHLAQEIKRVTTRPWTLMEVCGGQTHAILRFGLDQLLPEQIKTLSAGVTRAEIVNKQYNATVMKPARYSCAKH